MAPIGYVYIAYTLHIVARDLELGGVREVSPLQKKFSTCDEIWHVYMPYDPCQAQGQGHE